MDLLDLHAAPLASFRLKPGQLVAIRQKSLETQTAVQGLALAEQRRWDNTWLEVNKELRQVKPTRLPDESAVLFPVDVQLVIELYAIGA